MKWGGGGGAADMGVVRDTRWWSTHYCECHCRWLRDANYFVMGL